MYVKVCLFTPPSQQWRKRAGNHEREGKRKSLVTAALMTGKKKDKQNRKSHEQRKEGKGKE